MKFYYDCDTLPPELKEIAQRELGENEEVQRKTLAELKKLIKGERDFHPCPDDKYLIRFLRPSKYDVNKAFKKLKSFYKFKAQKSGTITDFIASDLTEVLNQKALVVLEDRDEKYTNVAIIRLGTCNLEKLPPEQFLAAGFLMIDLALCYEPSTVCGYSLVMDCGGLSLKTIHRFATVSFAYTVVHSLQDVMPTRLRSIHVINFPTHFQFIIKTFAFFLSEKLKKRLFIHGTDLENFHKHISPDILPEEYGGKMGKASDHADKINAALLSFDDYFKKMNKYGYEGKTLEKLKNTSQWLN